MILLIFHLLTLLIFIYLFINTGYLLLVALAGRLIPKKKFSIHPYKKKIAVLIPCYKEDLIIYDTASKAAAHDYPSGKFSVTVIADKLKAATVEKLRSIPVLVIEVDVNMKSRSLNKALQTLNEDDADIVMILDADNIMGAGCLEKLNDAFHKGYRAVQCHRTAKNKNTTVAWLDAMSEEININLFRRGPASAGLSAAPIGSGMGFELGLVKQIFSSEEILNNPGEDREIDMQLMKQKIRMEFIDDAYVFDEKVASAAVFEKQRVRWLEAQLNHIKRFYDSDMKDSPKTGLYYNKFIQTLILPRILTLLVFALIFFLIFLQWIFHIAILYPSPAWWLGCIVAYMIALFISIPSSYYSMGTVKALMQVPVLMFSMVKALLQVKKKREEFIHTPKTFTSDE